MSKNIKLNNTNYNGVSVVELPLSDGSGKAQFKDVDEIETSGETTTPTLLGTAIGDISESTKGKLVFNNITLEPHTVYAVVCENSEQTTDLFEIMFCTQLADRCEPINLQLSPIGGRKININSSGDYTGTPMQPTIVANDDNSVNIVFGGSNSYGFGNCYTYNLYKLGKYPTYFAEY